MKLQNQIYVFESGAHAGQSFEQVALTDYMLFDWLKTQEWYDKKFSKDKRERIDQIVKKLNNFIPAVKCQNSECEANAEYLTIARSYANIQKEDYSVYGIIGMSASTQFAWCKDHKNVPYEKAQPFEIKFNSLYHLEEVPKWVRRDALEVLLQCTGWNPKLKKTKENCKDFIDNLPQRGEQLGLNLY